METYPSISRKSRVRSRTSTSWSERCKLKRRTRGTNKSKSRLSQTRFILPDEERKELIAALKKKWEIVHKEYQQITHVQKMDTIGLRSKKENCEKELHQLEKDIEKLSKNYIFVDTTAPSTFY